MAANKKKKGAAALKTRKVRSDWRIMIIFPLLLVVVAATWLFFTSPAMQSASQSTADAVQEQSAADALQTKLTALNSGQATSAELYLKTARELDLLLPPTGSSLELIPTITGFGTDSGVVVTVTPVGQDAAPAAPGTPAAPPAAANSVVFDVSANGTLIGIAGFLDKLYSAQPLMTAQNFTFTVTPPDEDGTPAVDENGQPIGDTTVSFTLTVHLSPTPVLEAPTLPVTATPSAPPLPGTPSSSASPSPAPSASPGSPVQPSATPVPGATRPGFTPPPGNPAGTPTAPTATRPGYTPPPGNPATAPVGPTAASRPGYTPPPGNPLAQ